MSVTAAPRTTIEATEAQQLEGATPSAKRVTCPDCEKLYTAGIIVDSKPMFDDAEGLFFISRQFYCDHCNQIITWREYADEQGKPLGQIVKDTGSRIRNRGHIEAFLRHYPHAAGVQQS